MPIAGTARDRGRAGRLRRGRRGRAPGRAGDACPRAQLALRRRRDRHRRPRRRRAGGLRGQDPARRGFGTPLEAVTPRKAGAAAPAGRALAGSQHDVPSRRRSASTWSASSRRRAAPPRSSTCAGWPDGARPHPGGRPGRASTAHVVEVEADLAPGLPGVHPGRAARHVAARGARPGPGGRWSTAGESLAAAAHHGQPVAGAPAQARRRASTWPSPSRVLARRPSVVPPAPASRDVVLLGELGLDGRVRPVRGRAARGAGRGRGRAIARRGGAEPQRAEAALVPGVTVVPGAAIARRAGRAAPAAEPCRTARRRPRPAAAAAVGRQPGADPTSPTSSGRPRRGCAARGRGRGRAPPVPGRAARARARRCSPSGCPGCCRDLDRERGARGHGGPLGGRARSPPGTPLVRRPAVPGAAPHGATAAAIVGGGSGVPRPGRGLAAPTAACSSSTRRRSSRRACSTRCASRWSPATWCCRRAGGVGTFPARFQLVLAANPCPCGLAVGKGAAARARRWRARRYFGRLSGPLLDRVDLRVEVPARARCVLDRRGRRPRPWSLPAWPRLAPVPRAASRVSLADERRGARTRAARTVADRGLPRGRGRRSRGSLTLRGADRSLRVAWTLCDLAGRARPSTADVATALGLRLAGGTGVAA